MIPPSAQWLSPLSYSTLLQCECSMASLLFSPFRFTFTSSNSRFPFSSTRIKASLSSPSRVWTRPSNSMSEPTVLDDGDNVKAENSKVLVQYVVLRWDLIDPWSLGSVVTQACHASVCAVWFRKDDPHNVEYCSPQNIDESAWKWRRSFFFFQIRRPLLRWKLVRKAHSWWHHS